MAIPYVTFIKHAQKVTKSAPASRPVLKGVYHASDGSLAVTDSRRLYFAKNAHRNSISQTIDPKSGVVINDNYPDVTKLLPEPSDAKYVVQLDVKELFDACKVLMAVNKFEKDGKYPTTTAEINDTDNLIFTATNNICTAKYTALNVINGTGDKMTFNTQYFADAVALFKDVGVDVLTMRYYGSVLPFTLTAGKDDELLALLLPIRTSQ